jgi:putative heme-binding domain-containing protein
VTLAFSASGRFDLSSPNVKAEVPKVADAKNLLEMTFDPKAGQLIPLTVEVATGPAPADLTVAWHTAEDARPRPLQLHRMLLPFASLDDKTPPAVATRDLPELKGGSWVRGREVFYSEVALCSKCHSINARGGQIGPDLSNLIHRDYSSVERDVRTPSAAINPDYIAYDIVLKNGDRVTGPFRTEPGEKLRVGVAAGSEVVVERSSIKSMRALAESIMPPDIDKAIGPEKFRDLMTFLLTTPLDPSPIEAPGVPEARTLAQVSKVLADADLPKGAVRPLNIVLCSGPKDHGPGEHDYPKWRDRWETLLALSENVKVSTALHWPSAQQMKSADVIVFYSAGSGWNAERVGELAAFAERGGGQVYMHYAVNGSRAVEQLGVHIGLVWKDGFSRFRHGPIELKFTDTTHPITRGFEDVRFVDESYWSLIGDASKIHLLATVAEENQPRPLVWTHEWGKGRTAVNILGHYTWTVDDPLYRIMVLRGICWVAKEPVDRLSHLATIGARVKP